MVVLQPLLSDRLTWRAIVDDLHLGSFELAFRSLDGSGHPYSDRLQLRRCLVPFEPDDDAVPLDESATPAPEFSGHADLLDLAR